MVRMWHTKMLRILLFKVTMLVTYFSTVSTVGLFWAVNVTCCIPAFHKTFELLRVWAAAHLHTVTPLKAGI
jgi:hypothetical protein